MQRLLSALFVTLLVAAIGAVPVEARTNLNGSYAFSRVRTCTAQNNTQFDFDPTGAQTVITGAAIRQIVTDTGLLTFNPDGTGTIVGQNEIMNVSATAVGADIFGISEFSAPFTYTIEDDDTVDISEGVATFSIVLGAGTSLTGTSSAVSMRAAIGKGGNTLVSAGQPDIKQETVQLFNSAGSPVLTQYRLCIRSTTWVKQ
jgi:hypothetical protein